MPIQPRIRSGSIVLAALFLMVFGFLWYGVLFRDLQMNAHGYTLADYEGNSPVWYAGGAVISLLIAGGLALLVRREGPGFLSGAKAGSVATLWFGLPLVSYPFVYSPHHDLSLYIAGIAHILIGWTLAAGLIGALSRPSPVPVGTVPSSAPAP